MWATSPPSFSYGAAPRWRFKEKPLGCLVWDNAHWHTSTIVRNWIRERNQQIKNQRTGVRILPCFLPKRAPGSIPSNLSGSIANMPWLNSTGCTRPSNWPSATRAYYQCAYEAHLAISEIVSWVCTRLQRICTKTDTGSGIEDKRDENTYRYCWSYASLNRFLV